MIMIHFAVVGFCKILTQISLDFRNHQSSNWFTNFVILPSISNDLDKKHLKNILFDTWSPSKLPKTFLGQTLHLSKARWCITNQTVWTPHLWKSFLRSWLSISTWWLLLTWCLLTVCPFWCQHHETSHCSQFCICQPRELPAYAKECCKLSQCIAIWVSLLPLPWLITNLICFLVWLGMWIWTLPQHQITHWRLWDAFGLSRNGFGSKKLPSIVLPPCQGCYWFSFFCVFWINALPHENSVL